MIHQNDPLPTQIQKVPARNHTDVVSVHIQDREIPVTLLAHDPLDILGLLCHFKGNQVILFHKMRNRHTLIDHSGHSKRVMGRHNDVAVIFLGQLPDRLGYLGIHADYDAGRIHLDGTELRLISVA